MQSFVIFSGSSPIVVLTMGKDIENDVLLSKLSNMGIHKFIAYELPVALVKERYGHHFETALTDCKHLGVRVLDFNGERVLRLFKFSEFGDEFKHEPEQYTEHHSL